MKDPKFKNPMARNTDPETSHEAALDAMFHANYHRQSVLIHLSNYPGLTDYDLAALTGLQQNSIGKRRGECCQAGLVEKALVDGVVQKKPSPTGSMCIVWRLSKKGLKYLWSRNFFKE